MSEMSDLWLKVQLLGPKQRMQKAKGATNSVHVASLLQFLVNLVKPAQTKTGML